MLIRSRVHRACLLTKIFTPFPSVLAANIGTSFEMYDLYDFQRPGSSNISNTSYSSYDRNFVN